MTIRVAIKMDVDSVVYKAKKYIKSTDRPTAVALWTNYHECIQPEKDSYNSKVKSFSGTLIMSYMCSPFSFGRDSKTPSNIIAK